MSQTQTELEVVREFVRAFQTAHMAPKCLFEGTLQEATAVCWPEDPQSHLRVLAIFIQNGNAFNFEELSDCINSPRVKTLLEESFVLWGWDVTKVDKSILESLLKRELGAVVGDEIVSELSSKFSHKVFVLVKWKGEVALKHVMTDTVAEDEFFLDLEVASSEMVQRTLRLMKPLDITILKQDENIENRRLNSVNVPSNLQKRAVQRANQRTMKNEMYRRVSNKGIPQEPGAKDPGTVLIRIFPPNNQTILTRRFSENDTVEEVINFLISIGYPPDNHKVMGKRCRVDIGKVSKSVTLKSLHVGKVEQVTILRKGWAVS